MSYPLFLYELRYVHSPVVPGPTGVERGGAGGATHMRDWAEAHRWRRIAAAGRRRKKVVAGSGVRVSGGGKCARERERERERERGGEEGASAGVASPCGHVGPASGRWCGDATTAGEQAKPGRVDGGDGGLTSGPR
jgi:hypothetical protein